MISARWIELYSPLSFGILPIAPPFALGTKPAMVDSIKAVPMKTNLLTTFLLGFVTAGAALAANAAKPESPVKVTFVAPEKFTDVQDDWTSSDSYRDHVLGELRAQIESLARNYITGGRHLEVSVTDVDLAGDFEPWRGADFSHIRILRELYPPRMKLEFRLVDADGNVVSEGKRQLQQLGYLMTLSLPTRDPLRYDKEMIRGWMRQEFGRPS